MASPKERQNESQKNIVVKPDWQEKLANAEPLLANFYGIGGMGKDYLLQQVEANLNTHEIGNTGIITFPKAANERLQN